ncbi:HAD family hydrolase [Stratiformator vulcanicus]|uniref:phosphoglycolate phosphatase n=1 Tax=Stratiformator vulcanicus TaxID=2527980 RepID=A0A517R4R3_9PLAN|nr:HAD family hydrolase [Stratiformator vulcanicus]QDT38876.1 Phosphoglycolate phosphatase [Stratiformator vulcanicus]
MHVCLFDIDGTLLNTGGAGALAMERAVGELTDGSDRPLDIPYAGRTDRAIVADIFRHYELDFGDAALRNFLGRYVEHLDEMLGQSPGLVLPGVERLLAHLHQREDVILGLLTGNFIEGARLKLRHYHLDAYFDFALGGFGDTHADRDEVARVAFNTLKAHRHPEQIDLRRLWVIGDTPADVKCGRAIGAKVVAVATGVYSSDQLAEHAPDYLAEDFEAVDELLELWPAIG